MRRTARTLIISIALGAMTTVAAAWLVGNVGRHWPVRPLVSATRADGSRQVTVRPFSYGRDFFTVSPRVVDYVGQHRELVEEAERQRAAGATVFLPPPWEDRPWDQTPALVRSVAARHEKIGGVAQGWPWRTMYALAEHPSITDAEEYRGMFYLERQIYPFFFPWYIHWPAFALSTAFYAAPWLVVVGTPGMVRRWRRRRRGRCERCGYDLGGLAAGPCPECGATPRRRRAANEAPAAG